jgi:hypothetical protein
MKKIFIFLAVGVIAIVLLPLLGNKVVQNELDNRIKTLSIYGLQISKNTEESTYFDTKRHYEFVLKDVDKFSKYLQRFSYNQLPPYMDAMLLGVKIGVDMEYSNFLFDDSIGVDIYPLSLSKELTQDLQKTDMEFYKHIEMFLKDRGVLYHINYHVSSSSFDGYFKNIQEEYLLKDSSKMAINIKKVIFSGEGPLIAPTVLKSEIGHINLGFIDEKGVELSLKIDDFFSTSNFESNSTYLSTANFKNVEYKVAGTQRSDVLFKGSNFYLNASSNIQNEKGEIYLKNSFDKMSFKTNLMTFAIDNFNSDMALNDINKESFEELRVLLFDSKINNSNGLDKKFEKSILKFLSKGFSFNIADFSIDKFKIDNKNIEGFNLMANVTLKEDSDFSKNIQEVPVRILQNISAKAKFVFSKDMMNIIYKDVPVKMIKYAKKQGDDFVLNMKYENSKFIINDKVIK